MLEDKTLKDPLPREAKLFRRRLFSRKIESTSKQIQELLLIGDDADSFEKEDVATYGC